MEPHTARQDTRLGHVIYLLSPHIDVRFLIAALVAAVAIFVGVLPGYSSSEETLAVPVGQQSWVYDHVDVPVVSGIPDEARPLGIGPLASDTSFLTVHVKLPQFTGPVDIYGAYSHASSQHSTIGGNIACNAGGPRCLKYGVTGDYVLGLTVVLADGRILKTGGKPIKDFTGYDLNGLFTGSEGTLGLVTEALLRLIAKPRYARTALAEFASLADASRTVNAILLAGILPAALELMDQTAIVCIEEALHLGLNTDVVSVDPHTSTADVVALVFHHVFEGLIAQGDNFQLLPVLAEKWEVTPDFKVFTFHLRKGKLFHNGREMVGDDQVFHREDHESLSPQGASQECGPHRSAR